MVLYFRGALEITKQPPRTRSKTKVLSEEEVITSDEFPEILEQEKTTRQTNKQE